MSTAPALAPAGAWDLNSVITVNVHGHVNEPIDYRTLFAALALAEAGTDPDPAVRAVEENALPEGFGLASAAFDSIYPRHRTHLDPESLERAVRLARRLLGLDAREGVTA